MKKNTIKKLIYTAAVLAVFVSCAKDDTSPTGDDRDQFTGTWTVDENGTRFGHQAYTVTISKVGDVDQISIKNFYGLGNSFSAGAYIAGTGMTIFNQTVDGNILNGTGTLSGGKINLNYTAKDGSVTDTVTATYSH